MRQKLEPCAPHCQNLTSFSSVIIRRKKHSIRANDVFSYDLRSQVTSDDTVSAHTHTKIRWAIGEWPQCTVATPGRRRLAGRPVAIVWTCMSDDASIDRRRTGGHGSVCLLASARPRGDHARRNRRCTCTHVGGCWPEPSVAK